MLGLKKRKHWTGARQWTQYEVEELKRLFPKAALPQIAQKLGRTYSSTVQKATRLGLRRHRLWSQSEIEVLKREYYGSAETELMEKLQRTWRGIRYKAESIGLKRKRKSNSSKGKELKHLEATLIEKLYLEEQSSLRLVAKKCGVCHHTIASRLRQKNIPIKNRIKALLLKPTVPEQHFIEICEKLNLPFKYTGDGSFFIGRYNPDFIESNGNHIAIEIFGDYWHSPKIARSRKKKAYYSEEGRRKLFSSFGWKCIILWEGEIMSRNAEEIVLKRLRGV
jgi:G:T-mismatch repair DNA endonuclease (very short patch repair protein)